MLADDYGDAYRTAPGFLGIGGLTAAELGRL